MTATRDELAGLSPAELARRVGVQLRPLGYPSLSATLIGRSGRSRVVTHGQAHALLSRVLRRFPQVRP